MEADDARAEDLSDLPVPGSRGRVLFLARKVLLRNTRIFKQAKTLSSAGYEVIVVGIQPGNAPESEQRDGYSIVRLPLEPLHGRIPKAIRATMRRYEGLLRRTRLALLRRRRPPVSTLFGAAAVILALLAVLLDRFSSLLTRVVARALVIFQFPFRSLEYYSLAYTLSTTHLPRPTVVHANDLDTLMVARWVARFHRVPLVYDAQELYTGLHTLPRWYRWWMRLQERYLIRFADRVIAVNDAIAREMERLHGRKIDAVVLNCAPLEPEAHAEGPGLRERLAIPRETPVFLYSGALTGKRGIENTVLALRHLERGALVLLGGGPLRARLEQLARDEDLTERLFFLDFVPHAQVPALIRSADVGVIPYEHAGVNHYLSSPSKLFHYIQAELPIACSDFPFLRDIVLGNEIGTVFDPADPRSIAAALEDLTRDRGRHRQIRDRLTEVRQRYSWDEEEKKFLAVYASVGSGT